MAQALRSTSVALVLRRDAPADLAARWRPGMEAFVAVKPGQTVYRDDEETPIPNTYEGDGFRYYGFRLQAAGDEKKPINYPLPDLYHEIGYSGWDYLEGVARSVGFDFDDILGHKKGGTQRRGIGGRDGGPQEAALRRDPAQHGWRRVSRLGLVPELTIFPRSPIAWK